MDFSGCRSTLAEPILVSLQERIIMSSESNYNPCYDVVLYILELLVISIVSLFHCFHCFILLMHFNLVIVIG